MFGRPPAESVPPPLQPMSPTYRAPSGATGAFQAPSAGAQPPMAALAQQGPSEYTQLISRPANLGGGVPQQPPQQAPQQPMMQPVAMPGMQPPVLQPPILQPPVMQPPMMQPPVMQPPMMQPVIQPPVMQAPVIQPPMMAVPAPQPAKGGFPWLVFAIAILLGMLLATAVLLFVINKH